MKSGESKGGGGSSVSEWGSSGAPEAGAGIPRRGSSGTVGVCYPTYSDAS